MLAVEGETHSVRRRYDVGRASLALIAALIAAAGLYSAIGDRTLYGGVFVPLVVGTNTALATLFALWPSGPSWSKERRQFAGIFVVVAFLSALPAGLASIVVSGCACPAGGEPSWPSLLGIWHRYWILLALFAVPVLMAFAALLPRRERTPESPGA